MSLVIPGTPGWIHRQAPLDTNIYVETFEIATADSEPYTGDVDWWRLSFGVGEGQSVARTSNNHTQGAFAWRLTATTPGSGIGAIGIYTDSLIDLTSYTSIELDFTKVSSIGTYFGISLAVFDDDSGYYDGASHGAPSSSTAASGRLSATVADIISEGGVDASACRIGFQAATSSGSSNSIVMDVDRLRLVP